jgi:hypothetical protein
MRFNIWLPVLQTVAMLLIVWAPWAPHAHQIRIVIRDGREMTVWTLIPRRESIDWTRGLNLPADAVVTPAEFAIRKTGEPPNLKLKFFGLWVVGLLCWYMVGRFADDLLRWRRDRMLPLRRPADVAFALLAFPSAILLGSVFFFGGENVQVLAAWSAIWVVIASAAFLFRVAQFFRETFRPPVS